VGKVEVGVTSGGQWCTTSGCAGARLGLCWSREDEGVRVGWRWARVGHGIKEKNGAGRPNGLSWATANGPGRKTVGPHKTIGKEGKEKSHGPALRIRLKRLLGIETPYYFQTLL
jgi:hypothetical protein